MGQRGAREGLFRARLVCPCSFSVRRLLSDVSAAVSRAMRDHEMVPSSCVSLRMDAISADSTRTGMLDAPGEVSSTGPDGEGCLDVASAA